MKAEVSTLIDFWRNAPGALNRVVFFSTPISTYVAKSETQWEEWHAWDAALLSKPPGVSGEHLIIYNCHAHTSQIIDQTHPSPYPVPSLAAGKLGGLPTGTHPPNLRARKLMFSRRPQFTREWQQKASSQMWGVNTCGIHVILNDRAYQLRIKVDECWQPSEESYEDAQRLINSDLHGHITASHIEAWMFAKGFAKPQSLHERIKAVNDNGMARLTTARTARMNHDILDKYIEQERAQEIAAAAAANVTAPPAPTAPPFQPPRSATPRRSYVLNTTTDNEDEDVLSLNRKEFNRYVIDHEEHLVATAEKLRGEMAGLAHFVHKAEKNLRDQIQLKVAADLKLCRDVKKYEKWQLKTWQLGALPHGMHLCECDTCTTRQPNALPPIGSRLKYPTNAQDQPPQAQKEAANADEGIKTVLQMIFPPPTSSATTADDGSGPPGSMSTTAGVLPRDNHGNQ